MTEPSNDSSGDEVPSAVDRDSDVSGRAVRELVRGALTDSEDVPDLTRGFQRKIRVRSGGKFYTDGWSTAKHPPRSTYLVTSLLMLVVLLVIYALLAPLAGESKPAPQPKPFNVVPGR
jgi:nitric oxide reductase large subunit